MRSADSQPLRLEGPDGQDLSALLIQNAASQWLLVLAHGAGAGYDHAHMQGLSEAFLAQGIATLRFNFPFAEAGRRRVDGQAKSVDTIHRAAALARRESDLPLVLGGHSYGGRMATHAALAPHALDRVCGLVACSFPLHAAKKPDNARASHLAQLSLPVLYLNGDRDQLATPELMNEVVHNAGAGHRVHWLATADHSWKVLKRTRQDPRTAYEEAAEVARSFLEHGGV